METVGGFFLKGMKTAVFAGALCGLGTDVFALQASPARQEFNLNLEQTGRGSFEISNELDEPIRVHVSAKDWFVLPENKDAGVDHWLSLSRKQFDLEPGESQKVDISVKPGDCPSPPQGVLVGMVSFVQETQVNTGISTVVSASVYAVITGTEKKDASVVNFGLRVQDGQLQAGVVVGNKGNIHLRPMGRVELRDKKGGVRAVVPFQEGRPVYPGKDRNFIGSAAWPNLRPGKYQAHLLLQLWDKPLESVYGVQVTRKGEVRLMNEGKPL